MDAALVKKWLERILGHEGGLSLDGNDPGNWTGGKVGVGELKGTKYGIAANTYPDLDIRALTVNDAAAIYARDFLAPLGAERYPDGVGFQLLDFAVNSGMRRTVLQLQFALGLKTDGVIGPMTLAAVQALPEHKMVMLIISQRIEYMTGLRNFAHAGRGWMMRMARNLRYAMEDC